MAKVTGPLMSLDASGGFASTLVFGKWKGRNTVRQLVRPSNPQSADQELARNKVRIVGTAQHWANYATTKRSGETDTDKDELIFRAPAGQAWNGYLSKSMIGAGALTWAAMETAWTALSGGQKTAWDTAAAALTPVFPATAQFAEDGVPSTAYSAGHGFFAYEYGLYIAGVATAAPTGTPPTYS
jgi:hypothetical protein